MTQGPRDIIRKTSYPKGGKKPVTLKRPDNTKLHSDRVLDKRINLATSVRYRRNETKKSTWVLPAQALTSQGAASCSLSLALTLYHPSTQGTSLLLQLPWHLHPPQTASQVIFCAFQDLMVDSSQRWLREQQQLWATLCEMKVAVALEGLRSTWNAASWGG